MGKNSDPTRGCYGKQRFRSFRIAEVAARNSRKRLKERLQPYRCRHCRGFHFGHVDKRQARRTYRVSLTTEE